MFKPPRIQIGRQPAGVEALLICLVGAGAASALILSSGLPVKWLVFAMICIFIFSVTLIIPERERFFLYGTLFFCPYALIFILPIPKAFG